MKVQQLLSHHGIRENPFGQEDAQSDQVFKKHCLVGTHHPAWDKIFGNPADPATAVVFGEKGAGKTALRLQIVEQLNRHNAANPEKRNYIVEYDDFNPFLDCYRDRIWGPNRRPNKLLAGFRLWDHMDALLTIGVTRLVDGVLAADAATDPTSPGGTLHHVIPTISPTVLAGLTRAQRRDLLLLAAFYDKTTTMPKQQRWGALKKKLKFSTWMANWDLGLGVAGTIVGLALLLWKESLAQLTNWWPWVVFLVLWGPWLIRQIKLALRAWAVSRQVRVIDIPSNVLRGILSKFEAKDLGGQPMPSRDRSDDRYELLNKFQALLRACGFSNIVVLVDRVDEPHLINGSAERMRDLLWPMLDNKFLRHPGIGFKLLLPIELSFELGREDKEFYERSRLDKQNLIRSLLWSGESLFDIANDRVRAVAEDGKSPRLRDLFDDGVSDAELIGSFDRLRVPRHMFKFLYRLLVDHCNRYTDDKPQWKINRETLQSTLAVYLRDLQDFDRGLGTG